MTYLKPLQPLVRWIGRQRWIRFGIRDRLARLAENPDRTQGHEFRQRFFGGTYVGNSCNFIDWSTRYFGAYACEELELFSDLCGKSALLSVIDIGANVGHHSLYYALQGAEVLSFEPNPAAMRLLKRKIAVNPELRINTAEMGLSDRRDRLPLSIPDHANLGTASMSKTVGSSSVLVDVCCGDEMPDILQLQRIDWIKIDVEGHEISVLIGLRNTITNHCPPVFFEWNGCVDFSVVRSLFPKVYSFYRFEGDRNVAGLFARPGYRLQLLQSDEGPGICNILAWPFKPGTVPLAIA